MPTEHRASSGARRRAGAFTLAEILVAVAVGTLLCAGLAGAVSNALRAEQVARVRNDHLREARFAMERMVRAVGRTPRLVLPLVENPTTPWSESTRDVLAVVLDPELDRDGDGIPDADNDRDGRIDEDPGADGNDDGEAGLAGIDDDGDGLVDESSREDDDEDEDDRGTKDEEILDAGDDDADGSVDEDLANDVQQDGASGVAGVDDDGDGLVDESSQEDDDEDEDQRGTRDEDWTDTVAFRRQGDVLFERVPAPHAASGQLYAEEVLARGISRFEVKRLPRVANDRAQLVEITLEVGSGDGQTLTLVRSVRVGGEL